MFLFCLPGAGRATRWVPAVFASVTMGAFVAARAVPAYAPNAPRHLTVVHEDDDGKAAFLIDDNGPVPAMIAAQAKFVSEHDDTGYLRAPAPRLVADGRHESLAESVTGKRRPLPFGAVAPSAPRPELLIADGTDITQTGRTPGRGK